MLLAEDFFPMCFIDNKIKKQVAVFTIANKVNTVCASAIRAKIIKLSQTLELRKLKTKLELQHFLKEI